MLLRIYLGRAGTGKTGKIMHEINECVQKSQHNLILVVPEQYSHDAERLLCQLCGDSASMYAQVLSFTRMCSRAFSELGGVADRFLDDAGKSLVMSRAVELASQYTKVYGRLSKKSEFINKLVATAKEFRSSQITISDINNAAITANPTLRDKLEDISIIFQIYWSMMQNEIFDPDERLDRLAELLPYTEFTHNSKIWFDGFSDFTSQQYAVIKELLKCAADITFCFNCDSLSSDEPVFENSRNTVKKLIKLSDELGIEYKLITFDGAMSDRPDALRAVENIIISNNNGGFAQYDKSVSAFSCSDPTEECEVAAAKVIELVKTGCRYKDIAVAVGNMSSYTAILTSVFAKYNVPVYYDSKLDVLNMPPILAVISALKIINGGWSYDDVFTYLKTGFSNISREECDLIENYVLMWNIRGSMWYRAEDWTFSQGGYKDAADDTVLEYINNIRNKIYPPLIKLQRAMEAALNNADRITALCAFADDIELVENIEKNAEAFDFAGDRYMSECYYSVGQMLTEVFEQFFNVAGEHDCKTDEFIYQLTMLFSQYDIGVIPTSVDTVSVGDFSRSRKYNIKHLIVLGMTEDCVPLVSQSDGVFSDDERDELISLNFGLAQSSVQRLYGDLTSVYEVLTQPHDTLTLMYPLSDTVGGGVNPSYIFKNIVDALGIPVINPAVSEYKTLVKAPCSEFAAVYGEHDCVAAAAAEVLENDKSFTELKNAVEQMKMLHRKVLSADAAKRLYGDKVTMTASRVDKYKSCKYSYFLQYGLKAKPRTKAEFDASVIGTFMHYILENVTRDIESVGGFSKVSEEDCIALTKKYVAEFVKNELQDMKDKTARFTYLFNSLTDNAVSIVLNMAAELKNSDFKPLDFELDFSNAGDLPPYEISDGETSLAVRGIVDRVDGWVCGDKLYIRVVDYKTGVKTFNLSDIWYGMGMQMLIYLFALKHMGKERYNMDVVPAGVLYAPAREVLLAESRHVTEAQLEKDRVKNLKRSGLIIDDAAVIDAMEHGDAKTYLPVKITKNGDYTGDNLANAEQLGILAKHIDKVLLDISREIFDGCVDADPYYKSQIDNSCMYCDYYHACHYNENSDGEYRTLTKLKAAEVWTNLRKEAENE